ncbi:MAG TPA: beta-L-arabinofuranosidase domain-containing protein [Aggregatilineales bacterium]|nr:beta-L-arabinofuranosidase domain-containing protein [Aggregatilineales bacterium]
MTSSPSLPQTVSTPPQRTFIPPSLSDVVINDGFWAPRIRTNREHTIPLEYDICKRTGRIDALRLDWQPGMTPVPHIFWDSDTAKWIEAASYSLTQHPDPALDTLLDSVIALLGAAQQPDGYVNSYYLTVGKGKRWTNLRDNHELYCAGHLIEAAVAHFQATGKRSFLDIMCRYADYIGTVIGPLPDQKHGYCGHQEIELALVKLWRVTGNEDYRRLSQYFIDERGKQPHYFDLEARARGEDPADFWARTYEYNQSIVPAREQTKITGHAVRAMYYFSAMTDLAGEMGDEGLLRACERLWEDLCSKRLYITGGIGPSRHNEGFTRDYDLPNETAYAETCAAIGLVLWNHRMLQLNLDSRYADVMERALYNGVISGVALDGRSFFYENPLASSGDHHRQPWFDCACCPPNVARLLASLGQYIYAQSPSEIAVHLYVQGSGKFQIAGQTVTLKQVTNYPWDGTVGIQLEMAKPAAFALRLRIPGWCPQASVTVQGAPVELVTERDYLRLEREWNPRDRVVLELDMPIERVYAHPDVPADEGHVALQRGPIVYCLEGVDNAVPLNRIGLPQDSPLKAEFMPDLLGGVVVIKGQGVAAEASDWGSALYRSQPPVWKRCDIQAIPYCTWDNREPGPMRVWLQAP